RSGEGKSQGGADPNTPFGLGPLGGGGGGGSGGRPGGPGGDDGGMNGAAAAGGGNRRGDSGPTPPDGRYRYVDDDGLAIADPKAQPYAEFRMLPVIMRFVMDHRRLPEVLANCVQ